MQSSGTKLKVLHILLLSKVETNATYNEHCLAMADQRQISLCTYFKFSPVVPPPPQITVFEGNNSVWSFWQALKTALNAQEYDIIHAHTPHVGILFLILIFWTGKWNLLSSTVYTVHNSYPNYKFNNQILLLPIFALFRKLVCCSKASQESFPSPFKWLAGNRLTAVQNGVDINRVDGILKKIHTPDQLERNKPAFIAVSIGRLVPIKNHSVVLNALSHAIDGLENVDDLFVLIGEGKLKENLLKKIKKLQLEKQVKMTGLISRDEVYQYLSQADIFISASWGEGLPVGVLEAMACGVPVILSDIPPHREIAEKLILFP
jgi:glycosyltransferase involved in cell wall biosynthesis